MDTSLNIRQTAKNGPVGVWDEKRIHCSGVAVIQYVVETVKFRDNHGIFSVMGRSTLSKCNRM